MIAQWADEDKGEPFLWVSGPAGTGKSTLIRSVSDRFHSERRLVAGYFFKRGEQGRNDTNRFFSTLAMQLADTIPPFKKALRESLGDTDKESID
jgi:uridine kinase